MDRLAPPVTLAEQVADQLREKIATGELAVGDLIPTEMQLADDLGVSRNSVREALRSLVHAGLLRARAGQGTRVIAKSDLAPALTRRLTMDRADDVAEVRAMFEREAARLAATRATGEQLAALRAAFDAREDATDAPAYAAADLHFHRVLLDASGNALLAELGRGTGGNEQALLPVSSPHLDLAAQRAGALREVEELHTRLVEAIEARDPDRAAAVAERMVWAAHEPTLEELP